MKAVRYVVISDTHFEHKSIVEHGYRPENYEEKILSNLWDVSKPNDILIHLGDVSVKNHAHWTKQLFLAFKGKRKWLVKGNHDDHSYNWYINQGWDFVGERVVLELFKQKILLSHCPVDTTLINIHGHLHQGTHRMGYTLKPNHRLISMELRDYKPVLLTSTYIQ